MLSSGSIIRPSLPSLTNPTTAALPASKRAVPDDALVILPRTHRAHTANTRKFTARAFSARAQPLWKTSLPVRACPHRIARVSGTKAYLGNHTKVGGITGRRICSNWKAKIVKRILIRYLPRLRNFCKLTPQPYVTLVTPFVTRFSVQTLCLCHHHPNADLCRLRTTVRTSKNPLRALQIAQGTQRLRRWRFSPQIYKVNSERATPHFPDSSDIHLKN